MAATGYGVGSLVTAGVRTGATRAFGLGSAEVASEGAGASGLANQGGASTTMIGPYSELRGALRGTGEQAHHIAQDKAFETVVKKKDGMCVNLQGNAITDVGSPHYNAHASLEAFWNKFRDGGGAPTVGDYLAAARTALLAGGLSVADANMAIAMTAQQLGKAGLGPNSPAPRIPGVMRQVR